MIVRGGRPLAAALALAAAACGPRLLTLPSGTGAPAPDLAAVATAARRACRAVSSLTAEIGVSGSVGGRRLRARLLAGFADRSARLEAVAPAGAPFFIFVATGSDATLLLPRDDRVLAHGRPDEVLEAIAGIRLGPSELLQVLTGCADEPQAGSGQAFGDDWRVATDARGDRVNFHRDAASSPWRIVALQHAADAGAPGWRADYADFQQALPVSIHLVSAAARRFDLDLALSQVEINVQLGADAFRVRIPRDATPITLDELRESGPLAPARPSSSSR